MLTEAKKNLKLIGMYFKFNLAASMEYRASFLTQTFGMVLNNSTFIFFWWILFNNVKEIGGYGFKEVMIIWGIASTSYGLTFVLFGNIRRISQMIINGELDSYLLQPKDVLINIISSSTVISAWGDIFYGLILFIGVYGFDLIGLGLFIFFCFTGMIFFASVMICANTLTFYMGDSRGITGLIFEFMITFSIYPEGIHNSYTKLIIYTLLPSAFISLVPVRLMTDFSWNWFLLLMGALVGWSVFTYWLFMKGLQKYESGNLIVSKL
ncbi:ABC transporter permease [Alkaliphilus hydrothermalis]|uniref:ABC-2 type transport system permease protein n=1 Tax=Alkaliphilus hydrothermalis TaxID=1482730 RepID=A0ABS2NRT4_9FIRM|nr:ABC-2 family transporter protein [Alkaliphilus hydrothermalis]MBM7615680.1 ABC-2 type transport system permease protein [Alkaliphilus hydrothermalis]